jgi:predicted nucleic acid-binding protein
MKRVFIDSSVMFAAMYSDKGYAHDLIMMGVREQLQLVISSLVMEETHRNLAGFAPETLPVLERIFALALFDIVNPPKDVVIEAAGLVALKDAPILAAAKIARVSILITLDKRHLLDRPELEKFITAKILRPKEAYEWVLSQP